MASVTELMPAAIVSTRRAAEEIPFLLTSEMYFRMVETDIIPHDRRVFLWEGKLYEKMGKNQPHAVSGAKVNVALVRSLPVGWFVGPENPVKISDDKVPIPDFSVIRGIADDYIRRAPTWADVSLLVEVADSSVAKDRGRNVDGYARAKVPVYWVVNIPARRVEVYSGPVERDGVPTYASVVHHAPGDVVPLVLDGREVARIPALDLLPRDDTHAQTE